MEIGKIDRGGNYLGSNDVQLDSVRRVQGACWVSPHVPLWCKHASVLRQRHRRGGVWAINRLPVLSKRGAANPRHRGCRSPRGRGGGGCGGDRVSAARVTSKTDQGETEAEKRASRQNETETETGRGQAAPGCFTAKRKPKQLRGRHSLGYSRAQGRKPLYSTSTFESPN